MNIDVLVYFERITSYALLHSCAQYNTTDRKLIGRRGREKEKTRSSQDSCRLFSTNIHMICSVYVILMCVRLKTIKSTLVNRTPLPRIGQIEAQRLFICFDILIWSTEDNLFYFWEIFVDYEEHSPDYLYLIFNRRS